MIDQINNDGFLPDDPQTVHRFIDIDYWDNYFDSTREIKDSSNGVHGVEDLINYARLRTSDGLKLNRDSNDAMQVSTQLILWGRSTKEDGRHLTRIGGKPLLPKDWQLPYRNGKPIPFFGQVNFCDSNVINKDSLPGELLLLFWDYSELEENDIHFEWVRIENTSSATIAPEFVDEELPELTGYMYDTYDNIGGIESGVWESSKIGGVGNNVQLRHLFTISSFVPFWRFPYVNFKSVSEIYYIEKSDGKRSRFSPIGTGGFSFGDLGRLEVYVGNQGNLVPRLFLSW